MPCVQCGKAIEMTNEDPTTEMGETFREEYQCVGCQATGAITGVVGESGKNWRQTGRVFNDR